MPNILSIETSVPAASIALLHSSGAVQLENFASHRQQNQLLFPPLASLLATLDPHESIDLIIVGTGPGSYSGSRIAIAAAQGIAVAHSCPVVGICSFLATPVSRENPLSLAVGDARRDCYFTQPIHRGELPGIPDMLTRENFDQRLVESDLPIFTFEDALDGPTGALLPQSLPTADLLIDAWLEFSETDRQKLLITPPAPAYLRAPFITMAKPGHPLLRGKKS